MQFFATKKLSYLGVDLGNSSIKIVELKNEGGRPRLVTYGYAELPVSKERAIAQISEDELAVLINRICSQIKVTTKKAVAALPNFLVFSSIISLPEMSKKELDQAIVWEAKKFIPLPINEMNLYWEIIKQDENNIKELSSSKDPKQAELVSGSTQDRAGHIVGLNQTFNKGGVFKKNEIKKTVENKANLQKEKKHLKILVTAAPKKNVSRYLNIFQKAKLELITLETESFALERSLVGKEEAPVMIVDIGAISADLTIAEKGVPVLNRSVDIGGASITQHIASSIKVDLKRAEQFKKDIGFSNRSTQGIPKVIENSIEPIINEIRYCFDLYSSYEEKNKKVEKIILTGGSAFLPNLTDYLHQLLNIKVIIGDPWARVIYPLELKSILDELGPKFSVAVGLAMREIE